LKPAYDGSSEQLIPFLNRLDIRRQDEGWYPITFLTIQYNKYDLIRHFTKIDESVMLQEAKIRWTSTTLAVDKHTIDHPTYNARVLARLLLGSVTDDFCILIINRIPQEYRNDGPLILWIICNNVHRNNVAFVETIKCNILHIKDNLRLITSTDGTTTEHNDLIIYLFQQLKLSPITLFKEAVDKLHIQYLEAKLPNLTPTLLLKLIDDKMQTLKHADQWKENENPAIMALKLELQTQKQESDKIVRHLVAHVGKLTNYNRNLHHDIHNGTQLSGNKHPNNGYKSANNHPPWMIEPPAPSTETKLVDRRIYTWCTKCRQGQGLWVCRHNTETHVDGYTNNRNQRRRIDRNHHQPIFQTSSGSNPQNGHHIARSSMVQQPTAHFSLMDYLDDYLPEGESHDEPVEDETTHD
jgi:hypothetical protein